MFQKEMGTTLPQYDRLLMAAFFTRRLNGPLKACTTKLVIICGGHFIPSNKDPPWRRSMIWSGQAYRRLRVYPVAKHVAKRVID